MRQGKQTKIGKVKVYRFRLYDSASDDFKTSARMATQACIRRIHAQLLCSTEREIDKHYLDGDGMTGIMFADRLPAAGGRPALAIIGDIARIKK